MKTTRRQQRIEQIAGVIRENLIEQAHLLALDGKGPETEARHINEETGWSYDVRWADQKYPDDNAHTRVEGERLSETDLETAIKLAMQEPPRLYGINEIAEALGERRQTVALWHHRGKLPPPTQELGMGPAWLAVDIEEWISERRRERVDKDRFDITVRLANVIDGSVDDRPGPIDVEASCQRYADTLAGQLRACYPSAEVAVTVDPGLQGAAYDQYTAEVPEYLQSAVNPALGVATLDEQIEFHIAQIRRELDGTNHWVVYR